MSFHTRAIDGLPFAPAKVFGSCRRRGEDASPAPGTAILALKAASCRWPLGEPGEAGFRFCGGLRLPGRPYCAGHAARARL